MYNSYYPTYSQPYYNGTQMPSAAQPSNTNISMLSNAPTSNIPPNNSGLIWVQGEAGAKSYLVAPNTTILLMDAEGDRFFIKSTDNSGMPLPLRIFNYKEQTAQETVKTPINNVEKTYDDFITRKEFDEFRAKIEATATQKKQTRQKKDEGEEINE